jgi:F0F1-type ATP synthase delta subunit
LERLSRGATDTKRIELTGKDGGPITVAQELTADQRRELLGAAAAELNKRIKQQAIEESIIDGEVVEDE